MFSRKVLAAFITSVIAFFIVPLLFNSRPNEYFLVGWAVSTITVPFTFAFGVISSLIIEHQNERQQVWVSYLKHIGCSLICVAIFFLYEGLNGGSAMDLLIPSIIIGFIYTTIFFIADYVTKYFEARKLNISR